MLDFLEDMKFRKSEFEELDLTEEKIVYGRLKALEDLSAYIEQMRLSLTRLLIVNKVKGETEEEIKKEWIKKEKERKDIIELNKNLSDIEEEEEIACCHGSDDPLCSGCEKTI